ncbi:MocR-like pyridoxine biosynthesis transcription factor PdxR [Anaerosporobacter sp.]|uniref:MocR-like pyridoxine biosynthesis transcription factor PdxR n=1 Tax=Anaerosporobacter sp. TaxID=1872529 RepID=UPI00286ED25F|nr:PLP-dependent aminotransferase family protein [Anaerosporobacter sp.]
MFFTIPLNTKSKTPLYEQIYTYIKEEIRNNSLPYQAKLPSTRNLATYLQVSRNTVDMAYSQLVSEGYIESKSKSGYYVCQIAEVLTIRERVTNKQLQQLPKARPHFSYDFSPFAIDIHHFPYNTWRKLSKECLNNANNDIFLLGHKQGDASFREAIQTYIHESRGVQCDKEQIIVGAGVDYLLQLLAGLLQSTSHTCKIAMENPTYTQAYRIFHGLGVSTCCIPLDASGIHIDALKISEANIAYVTPSHQYPLGVIMPIKRRQALLQWANEATNRYIIEDDHDSEFRYKGKPIPALQGLDRNDKVIYIGTFSRAIAPAIRVGFLVLPHSLLELYKTKFNYYTSTVSRIDQSILTEFINGGYFERHLNKMRKHYKGKHDTLLQALKVFGNKISIRGEHAGLHLVVTFHTSLREEELIKKVAESSIKLYGLKEFFISFDDTLHYEPTILLGYANLTEEEIVNGIELLYESTATYFL